MLTKIEEFAYINRKFTKTSPFFQTGGGGVLDPPFYKVSKQRKKLCSQIPLFLFASKINYQYPQIASADYIDQIHKCSLKNLPHGIGYENQLNNEVSEQLQLNYDRTTYYMNHTIQHNALTLYFIHISNQPLIIGRAPINFSIQHLIILRLPFKV